jgi:hypothetical protein
VNSPVPERGGARSRASRAGLVTILLLVVVAVASRHAIAGGRSVHAPTGGGFSWVLDGITGLMALAVGFGLVVYWVILWPAGATGARRKRSSRTTLLILLAAIALLWLQLRYRLIHLHLVRRVPHARTDGAAGRPPPLNAHPIVGAGSHVAAPILFGLVLLGMVAAVALLAGPVRRHAFAAAPDDDEQAEAPHLIVARAAWDSLDDLLREPDTRRAVVAAYARMESGFQRAGVARHPAETPTEYLTRAFEALPAGREPAARLTALYQQARFSHHPVPPASRDAAVAALRDLARSLEAVPAAPTAAP